MPLWRLEAGVTARAAALMFGRPLCSCRVLISCALIVCSYRVLILCCVLISCAHRGLKVYRVLISYPGMHYYIVCSCRGLNIISCDHTVCSLSCAQIVTPCLCFLSHQSLILRPWSPLFALHPERASKPGDLSRRRRLVRFAARY